MRFLLMNEMVHEYAHLGLNGRPHGTVHQWVGDCEGTGRATRW